MQLNLRQSLRGVIAGALVTFFLVPSDLIAQNNVAQSVQNHVVSPADLQQQVTATSQTRQQNLNTVQQFLSTPMAEKAMKSTKMDAQQVKTAVATLDDQELAQLAARADKANSNFAAGDLSERDLILIILGIAVLVLIIVAVR
jgi:uncharacterized membrane protein YheB (UPF0754 family)